MYCDRDIVQQREALLDGQSADGSVKRAPNMTLRFISQAEYDEGSEALFARVSQPHLGLLSLAPAVSIEVLSRLHMTQLSRVWL